MTDDSDRSPPTWFDAAQAERDSRVALENLADTLATMIQVARALIETNRQIDLAGLETVMGRLCAGALDLPPEQGKMLRPRLNLLLAELDSLSAALAAANPANL
jgi:hypothetical protein